MTITTDHPASEAAVSQATAIDEVHRHLTFHRQVLPAWELHGDRRGVSCGATSHTWAEHRDRVFRLSDALVTQLGLARSDRFAVLALNSSEYYELYHAAYVGAAVINPLNIRLTADDLAFIIDDSGSEVLFVDATFSPRVDAIRAACAGVRSVVLIGDPHPDHPDVHDHSFDELVDAGRLVPPDETDEDDIACLMYTGGTTGRPKGVVHTQRSHVLTVLAMADTSLFGPDPDQRMLLCSPMFHGVSLGAILAVPRCGGQVIVEPRFVPEQVARTIEDQGVTRVVLVPVMIRMLLDVVTDPATQLSTVDQIGYGGSPMPAGLLQRLLRALPDADISQGYGMTEGMPFTVLDAESHSDPSLRSSAGTPVSGVSVSIQDQDGSALPADAIGEVCVRSGMVFREYWNRPEETAAAFRGGWLHTGDVGYLDEAGYLFLVDRANDMIITGGENVYSSEVESALFTHPAIADVAVIGIPSDQWGEAVHAVVIVVDGADLTAEDVIAHGRSSLAGYKVPRSVEIRQEPLPVSGAGKTLKRALRDPFWQGRTRRVH